MQIQGIHFNIVTNFILFTDSVAERTALTEKVYPNMRRYCAEHGFELEIFDLKWGLKDTSLDDHSHLETSLSALHKCVESGEGVNTLVSAI